MKQPRVEVGGVALGDQRIGVRRVADDEDLDVALGAARQRLALRLEDPAVGRQQVGALHALLARHRPDEQGDVGVAERRVGIVGAHDVGEQREGAVVELHPHAFEGAEGRRDLEQLQGDRSVGTEHRTGGDAEQQAVADLAGSPGDGDANGFSHRPPRLGGNSSDSCPLGDQRRVVVGAVGAEVEAVGRGVAVALALRRQVVPVADA